MAQLLQHFAEVVQIEIWSDEAMPPDNESSGASRGIGDNGGPPLDDPQPLGGWHHYCWKKAHARAWKTPPREIALARLKRAEELGMTYKEYTAIVLDKGILL